ncbi:MAG: GNAT family N-acetyltransferase [Chloroflexi bacterium]|nr:GNAT family N-acetyltransferase [Chloroflexota bacterium]
MRCNSPLSSGPGLLGSGSLRIAVLEAVRAQARAERALFVTYGHCSPDDVRWPALSAAGFHQYGSLSDMVLPIAWQSTTDYLSSLPGSDRRRITKQERRAEREGVRVERLHSPDQHARRLRELIAGVLVHHGTCDIYVTDFVEQAQAVCGTDLHVIAAWRGGEIIGCAVALRDGDTLMAKWLGLDYALSWGTSTYRLLLFRIVELAIELGVRTLSLGPTASETKQDFGAVASQRLSALAVLAPVPAWLVGSVAQLVAGRAAIDPTYSSARAPASPALPG